MMALEIGRLSNTKTLAPFAMRLTVQKTRVFLYCNECNWRSYQHSKPMDPSRGMWWDTDAYNTSTIMGIICHSSTTLASNFRSNNCHKAMARAPLFPAVATICCNDSGVTESNIPDEIARHPIIAANLGRCLPQ